MSIIPKAPELKLKLIQRYNMANCKCFRCNQGYNSSNEDDLAGDGECSSCKERSKKIALDINIKMAQRNKNVAKPAHIQAWLEQGGRLNARDLGLF